MKWPWKPALDRRRARVLALGDGPGLFRPVDPPLSPRLPSFRARDGVYKAISELAHSGAVDAGNGDVLDAWLDQLRPQWLAHHTMVGTDREAAAQLAAGRYEAIAVGARRRAEAATARRDDTQRLLRIYEQRLIKPGEAASMDHADRRRRPRPTLDTLEGITHQWIWRSISLILLCAAATGDFVNFWMVVAGLTGQDGTLLWVLTAAFAAAAVGLMHVAGRTARNLREGQGGLGRMALTVLIAAWTALGAAAFYVRLQVPSTSDATAGDIFGNPTVASTAGGTEPKVSAVLLAALYLAAGILAFFIGFADHHPRMTPFLNLRKQSRKQEREVAAAEQKALEAERLRDNAVAEFERTRARLLAAQTSVDAEIAELKELARLHLAGLVGDPAATNNLVTGRGPQPAGVLTKSAGFTPPKPSRPGDDAAGSDDAASVLNGHGVQRRSR